MPKFYWTWWKGGIALGLVSVFAFLTHRGLGASTTYPRLVALALDRIVPDSVSNNLYFQKVAPLVDWQMLLVLGVIVGGFIAAKVMGISFKDHPTPSTKRKVMMFAGGFLILFGSRLAGGCTSGHVITGMTQLSVGSFIFGAAVFAAGIPTALYLAKRRMY